MSRKMKKAEDFAKLQKAAVAFIHGGYWLLYLLLLAVIFLVAETQNRKTPLSFKMLLPLIAICILPNLLSFYIFYFPLFSKFLVRKKIFALVIFGFIISILSALFGAFLSLAFFGFQQPIFASSFEFFSITIVFSIIAAIHGGIALVIHGFIKWFDEIKLKEELVRKNFETEIALVKSQINPHFLFNTLNNIDVLITKDAAQASRYLNELSGILRYMVYETQSEKIALERELNYIEKYIGLQKIRTKNPDYINLEITGDSNNLQIAPMILFPFIENAFKHTENRKDANWIKIKTFIETDKIIFICENSYQKNNSVNQDVGGLGNDLIKKRLKILYPEKHTLAVKDSGEVYAVKLTLYEN